jgi:hypothetical protein
MALSSARASMTGDQDARASSQLRSNREGSLRDSQTRFHFLMATAAEANTATNPKSGQGNDYKEMYSKSRPKALPSGVEAPDFTLRSTPDQWLALSEFRGQPVVLAFLPS